MTREKPDSAYVTISLRLAKVLKKTALKYISAQERILGRRLAFNQLVVDALVDKLVSEGFLPEYLTEDSTTEGSKPDLGSFGKVGKE